MQMEEVYKPVNYKGLISLKRKGLICELTVTPKQIIVYLLLTANHCNLNVKKYFKKIRRPYRIQKHNQRTPKPKFLFQMVDLTTRTLAILELILTNREELIDGINVVRNWPYPP